MSLSESIIKSFFNSLNSLATMRLNNFNSHSWWIVGVCITFHQFFFKFWVHGNQNIIWPYNFAQKSTLVEVFVVNVHIMILDIKINRFSQEPNNIGKFGMKCRVECTLTLTYQLIRCATTEIHFDYN